MVHSSSPLLPHPSRDSKVPASVLEEALQRVCKQLPWDYAEFWQPCFQGTLLELHPLWAQADRLSPERAYGWQQFRYCSEAFLLSPGEGLPGRVWLQRQPQWIADVTAASEDYFLRNQIAKAFEVRAGLGIPCFSDNQIQGVIVCFQAIVADFDPAVLAKTLQCVTESLAQLGGQV